MDKNATFIKKRLGHFAKEQYKAWHRFCRLARRIEDIAILNAFIKDE